MNYSLEQALSQITFLLFNYLVQVRELRIQQSTKWIRMKKFRLPKSYKDEVLQDYNKVIELVPNYSNSYYNRGNLFEDIGKEQQELLKYRKPIDLDPNYSKAYIINIFIKIILMNRSFIIQIQKQRYGTNKLQQGN